MNDYKIAFCLVRSDNTHSYHGIVIVGNQLRIEHICTEQCSEDEVKSLKQLPFIREDSIKDCLSLS